MSDKDRRKLQTVTLKLPVEIIKKIDSSLEGKTRSDFIREAILEKLEKEKDVTLSKISRLEMEIEDIKKRLFEIERTINMRISISDIEKELMVVAKDEIDRLIVGTILEKGYVKVMELEKILPIKRRQIVNRLRRIADKTKLVKYIPHEKDGITKAWWLITQ